MGTPAIRNRFFFFIGILALSALNAFGQTCTTTATAPTVHAEGLAELLGNITIACVGGTAGATAKLSLIATLNTNITNRIDANNNLTGITVTIAGATAFAAGPLQVYSATSVFLPSLSYTIPPGAVSPVTITISGVRAAVGSLGNGTGRPIVTATVTGIGAQFATVAPVTVALSAPTLLASVLNNGIPCNGSPVPPTIDFPNLSGVGTLFATVRLTEAVPTAFTPNDLSSDTGLRFLVNFSGYPPGAQIYVPDAIVGSDGTVPTSGGAFNSTVNSGTYAPNGGQLLLIRVNGAGADGAWGSLALPVPTVQTTYTSVSQINLVGGAGYAVYEVVSANPNLSEIAQVPVFLTVPPSTCSGAITIPQITAVAAPVSNVNTSTMTDAIPRFLAVTPPSDCQQDNDCSAAYFPSLSVNTTPINLTAASLGSRQGATVGLSNPGGGVVGYTVSVTYGTGAQNWLTVTPTSGQLFSTAGVSLQVFADPSVLQPGTYTATITVNGGTLGTFTIPVTFTVGPPGVTISNVLNAATGTSPVAPGSYVALYGLNMAGQNISVTFNGISAQVIYSNATQINVVVPAALASVPAADVVAHVDGKVSNSFKVQLALNAPGIFNFGIENADGSVNSSTNAAANGSFVAIYLTGLAIPLTGQVTVNIGSQSSLIPLYAGAQPTYTALDQVNVTIPTALAGTPNPIPLTVCIPGPAGQPVCSNPANIYIK